MPHAYLTIVNQKSLLLPIISQKTYKIKYFDRYLVVKQLLCLYQK